MVPDGIAANEQVFYLMLVQQSQELAEVGRKWDRSHKELAGLSQPLRDAHEAISLASSVSRLFLVTGVTQPRRRSDRL